MYLYSFKNIVYAINIGEKGYPFLTNDLIGKLNQFFFVVFVGTVTVHEVKQQTCLVLGKYSLGKYC